MATPKLRFKEFDGDWLLKSINDISTKVGSGSTPRGGSEAYVDEGIIFIRSQNVNDNQLILDDVAYIPESTHAKMSGSKVLPNDILLNITGASIGRSCVVPETFSEGNVNQHVCIIRTPNDDPIFVQSFLSSENGQNHIQSKQVGGGREGLNFQAIRSIDFEMPSKEEQTKIASFLSTVDEKISQLTQKHELLSQYKQGMMQKLFSQQIRFKADDGSEFRGWEDKKLGDICSHFQSGKTITSATISDNGAYPVFGGNGLRGFTDTYTHDGIFALIGRQGALCGNINLVQGENFISEHAIAVQANQESSTQWLAMWLDFMQLNRFSESSAQAGLAVNKLVKFDIKVPCLEEQTKIANFLSAIDQKIEGMAQQIEQAKQWKKGLLQQMFV